MAKNSTLTHLDYRSRQAHPRLEDSTLVCGLGDFTDDAGTEQSAFGYVIRSPLAAAKILRIDRLDAESCSGLIGILTGADLRALGIRPLPFMSTVNSPDGRSPQCTGLPVLAVDEVRYVGQAVAFVVAESREKARDIAELINVEYEERPTVVTIADALAPESALVDPAVAKNIAAVFELGDLERCERLYQASAHKISLEVVNNRVIANPMEPRACIGTFDATAKTWTLRVGNQGAHHSQAMLAECLDTDAASIHLNVPDIGGAFGSKLTPYPEDALVLVAAREFRRTVRWRADRSESFLADYHARDHMALIKLGFDDALRVTALIVNDVANLGAYPSAFGIPIATTTGNRVLTGVYDIPLASLNVKTILTNTSPTAPYRGAGRPEVIHRLEMAFDKAAQVLNVDAAEIRQRNLIKAEQIPYRTASGLVYDSGNFPRLLTRALTLSDWDGFETRKKLARQRGRLLGHGICCHIDSTSGLEPSEVVAARVLESGNVEFYSGTQEMGQGLVNTYRGMAASVLNVNPSQIDIVQGDTARVSRGIGSYGSRSLAIGGAALVACAEEIRNEILKFGARNLGCDASAVKIDSGIVNTTTSDQSLTLADLARSCCPEIISATGQAEAPFCFPNGCYVCEVEIDPQTGALTVERFSGIDDVGHIINLRIVDGQTHGGLAQGIGQALLEHIEYDTIDGQLLTGTLLDYALPRALDLPMFNTHVDESEPATTNSLGVKGAGESGAIGGPPALISAIANALGKFPIDDLHMPLTAEKIWRAASTMRLGIS